MRCSTLLALTLSLPCLQAQAPPPDAGLSTLATPIRVDLGALLGAAERNTPRVPPGVENWINLPGNALSSPAYRFNLYRDPLVFAVNGQRLGVHTTVHYWMEVGLRMRGWVKGIGACGRTPEPFRRAYLGLTADLGLTPDWHMDIRLHPEEPQRLDGCQVTSLGYDITDKVLGGMKDALFKGAAAMEQQVKTSPVLRQRAEALWLQAQQPVELRPGLYLMLNPERVRLAPWTSQGYEITITPEIQARPTLVLGPRPQVQPKPLPPLDLSGAPIQPGLKIRVEGDLPLEQANAQMAPQLVGKKFETSKGKFEIRSFALRSKGDRILVEVGLKGKVDGTLNLLGRPVYDEKTGQVRLADLDYTLESKSWITKIGEWLYRSDLHRMLTEKCTCFMDDSFRNLRAQAQQGLNRSLTPEIAMSGAVDTLSLNQVEVLPDRLHLVVQLAGQVQIAVKTSL